MQILKRRSDAIYLTEMGAFIARRIILRRLLTMPVPCLAKLENYDDVTFADEEAGFEIFGVVTHVVNDMSMSEFDDNPCM